MIPTPGRIVEYALGEWDADSINKRRDDANRCLNKHREDADGSMVHVGNHVRAGDTYPMVIVRCWGTTEGSSVNGQVFLDGNDTYWATSRSEGDAPGQWRPFARMEG